MEKTQREYYLNEQLKAIQKELGEIDEEKMKQHLYLKLLQTQKCLNLREKNAYQS